jgi:hypothetical protein
MTRLLYAMTSSTATPADYYSRAAHALTTSPSSASPSDANTPQDPTDFSLPPKVIQLRPGKAHRIKPAIMELLDAWHASLPPDKAHRGWTADELALECAAVAAWTPTTLRNALQEYAWPFVTENRGSPRARTYWFHPSAPPRPQDRPAPREAVQSAATPRGPKREVHNPFKGGPLTVPGADGFPVLKGPPEWMAQQAAIRAERNHLLGVLFA